MRKERVQGEEEGGRGVRGAEMVVVLIRQRNTALRVLLKRPHKPELSLVGGRRADVQATRSSAADLFLLARPHARSVPVDDRFGAGSRGHLFVVGATEETLLVSGQKNKWKLLGQSSFFREL